MARIHQAITVAAVAVTAVSLAPAVSFAAPAPAPAPPAVAPDTSDPDTSDLDNSGLAPGMLAAMRRDLRLDDAGVARRLRTEAAAPVVEKRLRARLGAAFGGAWIPDGGDRLTVAVTSAAAAARARAEGADARIVRRSEADLAAAHAAMDRRAAQAGADIRGWYADVTTNSVVVLARPGAEDAARRFARDSGAGTVTVVPTAERPRPLYDIRGGDQYVINGNTLCSVGFAVAGGFVTAGHCGGTGSPTLGHNNVAQGNFAGSSFPGNDYGWVRTNGNWTPQPWVNNYSGGNVTVAGSADAAIGSSICRSGRTTGWRCGTLLGRNETINYAQGSVSGLSRSNACAEPGDSGGSWISGNQAQGVTSGGSGNCSSGATMWFQPVNEILGVYGLSLTTSGGGSTSAIVSTWNNKCVDVPNWNFADGQRLVVWDCTGGTNQRWEWVNGTLRTQNNLCMDVAGGGNANGTAIQVATCNGTGAQQFVLSAAGDLVNPQANKCVDIAEANPNNDAVLHLWECVGVANQKWRRG
jgi:streptogrisin C